jgi:hypothetical protein
MVAGLARVWQGRAAQGAGNAGSLRLRRSAVRRIEIVLCLSISPFLVRREIGSGSTRPAQPGCRTSNMEVPQCGS